MVKAIQGLDPKIPTWSQIPYVSLRIPKGWYVDYNQFFDIYPGQMIEYKDGTLDDTLEYFQPTMLVLHFNHDYQNGDVKWIIDLGYSYHANNGSFVLTVIKERKTDDKQNCFDYIIKSKDDVVDLVNKFLNLIFDVSVICPDKNKVEELEHELSKINSYFIEK